MSTLEGGSSEERLPVMLSGVGGAKLLGAPALPPREDQPMGDLIAEAAVGCAESWNCSSSVVGMVFDTTSSNSGIGNAYLISMTLIYQIGNAK